MQKLKGGTSVQVLPVALSFGVVAPYQAQGSFPFVFEKLPTAP